MKHLCFLTFTCLTFICPIAYSQQTTSWVYKQGNLLFSWDLQHDKASLKLNNKTIVWKGSLLPSFWLQQGHEKRYVKATINWNGTRVSENELSLNLHFGSVGDGNLVVEKKEWGINFRELNLEWKGEIPKIITMYFGTSLVKNAGHSIMPNDEFPFWPDWEASGFCIPGAKAGPAQSYFRNWDFGQADIALGNFGPSLGTPYGAAFPRPVLFFAMGQENGWIVFGAGSLPDAPMSLKVQATLGCLKYLYREDLWSNNLPRERTWQQPLKITFGNDAWDAFKKYYASFPAKAPISVTKQKAIWNTWGNWRHGEFAIKPLLDFAKEVGAEIFVTDDPWETSVGTGKPNYQKFPHFDQDLDNIRKDGMKNGIWETLAWISDTTASGLSSQDLIVDRNGILCKVNWNFNPFSDGSYCIDVSSERARNFLKNRTIWTMNHIKPKLIKLDFGYATPNPNMGVPRNPKYRGERYCYELIKIIADAARSVDSTVIIMYYGISPLYTKLVDMISLDDQGDLGYEIKGGHAQWSVWASLLSDRQVALNGSSSYDWGIDDEVLLNTVILGSPGAVLPTHLDDGSEVPLKYINRRLAVNKWYRKSIQWNPLWLNSHRGNLQKPIVLNCWGRLENNGKDSVLTALVLREDDLHKVNGLKKPEDWYQLNDTINKNNPDIGELRWKGRWALISQDNKDIFSTSALAIIPFDPGAISVPYSKKPARVNRLSKDGETAFDQWEWGNGRLIIKVSDSLLDKTAGFIVNRADF